MAAAGTTTSVLAAVTAAMAMQVGEGLPLGLKGEGIILITLSEEVVILTIIINHFILPPPHKNHHPASTLCNAPPSAPLYPYHLMLIVRSLLFGHQRLL